jgi:hypothetical protein
MTAQDLKNSILQEAVQGRLVEQCAEEGTAAELLKKIAAEKAAGSALDLRHSAVCRMMEIHAAKCMNFVCKMRGFYLTKHNPAEVLRQ